MLFLLLVVVVVKARTIKLVSVNTQICGEYGSFSDNRSFLVQRSVPWTSWSIQIGNNCARLGHYHRSIDNTDVLFIHSFIYSLFYLLSCSRLIDINVMQHHKVKSTHEWNTGGFEWAIIITTTTAAAMISIKREGERLINWQTDDGDTDRLVLVWFSLVFRHPVFGIDMLFPQRRLVRQTTDINH